MLRCIRGCDVAVVHAECARPGAVWFCDRASWYQIDIGNTMFKTAVKKKTLDPDWGEDENFRMEHIDPDAIIAVTVPVHACCSVAADVVLYILGCALRCLGLS